MLRDAELAAQTFSDGNQRYEWQYQTRAGEPFWAEVLLTSVAIDHEHLSYAVIRDISLRKSTERTLTMAAQVFENCRDAILILDSGYRVVAVNQAFTDITGFAPADVIGREVPSLRAGLHEPAFYQQIWDYVAVHDHWEGEVFSARRNGEVYPVWVGADGDPRRRQPHHQLHGDPVRHHRPQAGRGADPPPGRARLPDRPAEPGAVPRPPAPGAGHRAAPAHQGRA